MLNGREGRVATERKYDCPEGYKEADERGRCVRRVWVFGNVEQDLSEKENAGNACSHHRTDGHGPV